MKWAVSVMVVVGLLVGDNTDQRQKVLPTQARGLAERLSGETKPQLYASTLISRYKTY